MDAQFLDQFENELAYLRETGSEFARRYPTLAGRLGMDQFHCNDPLVERLLEGFAFMSARVHRRLDAEFPRFTTALLDSVFPLATRPIPATGIFRIEPVLDEGSLLAGYTLPRGTRLLAEPAATAQTGCRFDLTDQIQLWPLKITQAQFLSREQGSPVELPACFQDSLVRSVLLLTLKTTIPAPMSALPLDAVRLHLRGGEVAHQLLEYLLAHADLLAVHTTDESGSKHWTVRDAGCISAVGFADCQSLFPEDRRVFSGHRLLQEYFMLPEKFLFVDIEGLRPAISKAATATVQLAIGFDQSTTRLVGRVAAEHFDLFCAPAINLFKRRTDRVWLDHTQHEHHLIADRSRVHDFEIWSIEEVALHTTSSSREARCRPLYAQAVGLDHPNSDALFFAAQRRPHLGDHGLIAPRAVYPGTELMLSLTDASHTPRVEDFQQLSATTYCTNRALPLLSPECGWREAFYVETAGPIAKVVCVTGPTPPRPALAANEGEVAWRLINQLTPNYASLIDCGHDGCGLLRELLQLFCPAEDQAARRQIDGVQSIRTVPVVRRSRMPGPLTYARGVEIELTCDEQAFHGSGAFALASVLEQYLARYVSLNSFTELQLTSPQRGNIHRWPPRSGTTPIL